MHTPRDTVPVPPAAPPDQGHRDAPLARRSLLVGVAGGTLALAACGSGSSGSAQDTAAPGSAAASSTPSTAASSAPSSAASGPASASASSGGGPTVVALADVPVGGAVAAKLGGKPIVVAQPTAGTVRAFSAICTHQGCTVAVKGAKLDCPCHGSVFDALTGAVDVGPATVALPAVAVRVSGADVVAGS